MVVLRIESGAWSIAHVCAAIEAVAGGKRSAKCVGRYTTTIGGRLPRAAVGEGQGGLSRWQPALLWGQPDVRSALASRNRRMMGLFGALSGTSWSASREK